MTGRFTEGDGPGARGQESAASAGAGLPRGHLPTAPLVEELIGLKANGARLGRALRARRKETGRTLAAVAVDAGLSVPYIANLENGRGNPTLAALDRLATALGTRLTVELAPGGDGAPDAPAADAAARLAASERARAVADLLAADGGTSAAEVRAGLASALRGVSALTGADATARDLDRLLDLLLLARRPAP